MTEPADPKTPPKKPAAPPKKEAPAAEAEALENPFPNRADAPGLEGGKEWLNVGGEITLKDLRGKVVLLDFWTYCCINCMHVLPDLEYLEEKYSKELVVIGVHSAKFDNEKDSKNIRDAILRYEIKHPVINDANMTVWRKFGVNSWPTLVLIDPEGMYCGYVSGEGNREVLDAVIGRVVAYHKAKKTLDETPLQLQLESNKARTTPLRYPGKILADESSNRLFISDSNHNRIVISTLDGTVTDVIGTGEIGRKDGSYDTAQFDHPQGFVLDGSTLYVADTENHLLRAIDLDKKEVTTLAGTGEQALGRLPGGPGVQTALNSPWDLALHEGMLFIAMAGPHQIWTYDLTRKIVAPYSGSGREDITDGPLDDAAHAQPSGIVSDGKFLYVVDSEGSSVRKVPLNGKGRVATIVGSSDLPRGRCLFEFGDRDGIAGEVRLQHPLGLVHQDGILYVADSYNHKLKKIDIAKRSSETFLGTGQPGTKDDPAQFSEPAGLSIAGGNLYVADTNNHLIRVVDLATKKVSTLELKGLTPPTPPADTESVPVVAGAQRVPVQSLKGGEALLVEVKLTFPEGHKLNKLAPVTYRLDAVGPQELIAADLIGFRDEAETKDDLVQIKVPLAKQEGTGELRLTINYPYCREGVGGLCKLKTVQWLLPLDVSAEGKQAAVELTVDP